MTRKRRSPCKLLKLVLWISFPWACFQDCPHIKQPPAKEAVGIVDHSWSNSCGLKLFCEHHQRVWPNRARIQIRPTNTSPLVPSEGGWGVAGECVLPCSKSHTCYGCFSPRLHLSFRAGALSLVFLPWSLHKLPLLLFTLLQARPPLAIVPGLPLSHSATCLTFQELPHFGL